MSNRRKIYRYKGVRTNMLGLPILNIKITPVANAKSAKRTYLQSFFAGNVENLPKNLLVIYDIPHNKKTERDWFRRQLKTFGFSMIQKSVWVGPSPLPADFLAYIKMIGIKKEFKTFKLARPFTQSS